MSSVINTFPSGSEPHKIDNDKKNIAKHSSPTSLFGLKLNHSCDYFAKCMIGGILSCGLTHTLIVPLDIIKCRMQVFPNQYTSLVGGLKNIVKNEGVKNLTLGYSPTFIGYSLQGLFKFGFYEIFKDVYSEILGEKIATDYKGIMWLSASASAEFFADIALCPMEMLKVKMQTSLNGFPRTLCSGTKFMIENKETTRFPFGSIVPLWSRQIPYTMAKFYFFEKIVQKFYDNIFTSPKDTYNKATQLSITFASGYLAGVICAIVSHPADTIVSQIGKEQNKGKSICGIMRDVGMKNLFTKGLGTRVLMIGTLTGLQWWIYDSFKATMGMGTTGGGSKSK